MTFEKVPVVIDHIEINQAKSSRFKTFYKCNENLELDNLWITVYYNKESGEEPKDIKVTKEMVRCLGMQYLEKDTPDGKKNDDWWLASFVINYQNGVEPAYFDVYVHCKYPEGKGFRCCEYWNGVATLQHKHWWD